MCIRDRPNAGLQIATSIVQPTCHGFSDGSIQLTTLGGNAPYQYNWVKVGNPGINGNGTCLLYTSDAAEERSSVDLGGRRIIKKKKTEKKNTYHNH